MEEGKKTRKRKAEKLLQVQWQEDYRWEGGHKHAEEEGKRKAKKKKKKKKKKGEASSKDHTVLKQKRKENKYVCIDPPVKRKEKTPKNVCRDHAVLKQKGKENKLKNVCRDHTSFKQKREEKPKNVLCRGDVSWPTNAEEAEDKSNSISDCTEHACEEGPVCTKDKSIPPPQLKEHEPAQEDVNHGGRSAPSEGNKLRCMKIRFSDLIPDCKCKQNVLDHEDVNMDLHGDRSGNKPPRKKVRFSDQIPYRQCKESVSHELCTHCSVSKESLANGELQDKCTSTCSFEGKNEREDSAASFQDGFANPNASLDEKVLLTRRRQRNEDDEIWGLRFTPEEDEILKNAVREYIKVKGWEEKEGIEKILNCRKHKEAYNCWAAIRLSLPKRPRRAVRYRAYRLFEECTHSGPWSKEELELLKRLHETHGSQWKNLSTMMGRSQYSISGKWRILKRPNPTGVWTWDEIQRLSDMVHKCLRLKALFGARNGKSSRNHYLRDNISWDEIADSIGTHNHGSCCTKWYCNLSSSMVVDGLWASEDDYLLLKRLLESGACLEEEVEWHRLLIHRSGQTCLFRWKQMAKHLGENRTRGFLEKLDSLVRRYAPELVYPKE